MNANEHLSVDSDNDFDVVAIWRVLWFRKFTVIVAIVLSGLGAAIFAFTATPIYRAEVVVTDARSGEIGGASSLTNQLGGLASLAGVSLGGGESQEAKAVLLSRRLVGEFISRHNLFPELVPNHSEKTAAAALWYAEDKFRRDVLSVREDTRKKITTITVDWRDPDVAADWANHFVVLANELVRVRAMADATRNIEYLNKQTARTDVVEIRRIMYNLIETETKNLMLASVRDEYAFRVIDPAVSPAVRSSPRRTIIVLVGLVLGAIVGIGAAFGLHTWQQFRAASNSVK